MPLGSLLYPPRSFYVFHHSSKTLQARAKWCHSRGAAVTGQPAKERRAGRLRLCQSFFCKLQKQDKNGIWRQKLPLRPNFWLSQGPKTAIQFLPSSVSNQGLKDYLRHEEWGPFHLAINIIGTLSFPSSLTFPYSKRHPLQRQCWGGGLAGPLLFQSWLVSLSKLHSVGRGGGGSVMTCKH